MTIDGEYLQNERVVLKKEFDNLNAQIKKLEMDLGSMRANLNAIHGAIQQTDKLIGALQENDNEKL